MDGLFVPARDFREIQKRFVCFDGRRGPLCYLPRVAFRAKRGVWMMPFSAC